MSSPGSLPSASAYNREKARSIENRSRDGANASSGKQRLRSGEPTSSPTHKKLPPLSQPGDFPSPTAATAAKSTSDDFTPRHGRQNTEDPLMVDADSDNPRAGRRVYQMSVSDLFACTTSVCTSVLQAVTASLGDGYLSRADAAPGGVPQGGTKALSDASGGADIADAYSMSGSTARGSRDNRSRNQRYGGKHDGRSSSSKSNKYPVPATTWDLTYLIRPPRSVTKYKTNSDMLRTVIPFGFIIPLVGVSIMLVIYNYAGVRICGMDLECECDAGERALFFSTFGLFQDVPCALIFSCLVAAAVFQGKQCDETTKRRKEFNTPKTHKKNQISDGATSRQDFTNIDTAERGGMSEHDKAVSLTYGPYSLKNLSHYLTTREVIITAIFTAVLPIIARAVTLMIGTPYYLILPVTFIVKCIPLLVYAAMKRNMMAAVPCVILIFIPISYQIFIRHIADVYSVREYVTGFWPLIIVVVDRLFLLLLKLTTHPSTCVGSLTIYTTLLSFTTQTLQLGLGVTIDGPENPAVISVYVFQFIIFEMFLNTVLLSRLGCYIVRRVTLCRYNRAEAAAVKKADSGGSTNVASTQKPPEEWKYNLRLTDISNIAALTRLPTLFISFLFMIPALHFPKWPQKTPAISCEGNTTYKATWVNYGFVIAVCLLIVIATLLMRRVEKRNMVLQFVFGQGWCMLVAVYLFSIVVLSLGFLPTTLFFTAFSPTSAPDAPTNPNTTTLTTTSAP